MDWALAGWIILVILFLRVVLLELRIRYGCKECLRRLERYGRECTGRAEEHNLYSKYDLTLDQQRMLKDEYILGLRDARNIAAKCFREVFGIRK
ncbi:hypothetical protein kuro4_00970 [Gelria sp. Kuro-4]|nr:hypothetical protein kuro4_00970 [Gelria sp. Kuro-4]